MIEGKSKLSNTIINYVILLLVLIVSIGPFLWMFSTSLKSPTENLFKFPPDFLPQQPTLNNLSYVLTNIPFWLYFKNSMFVSFVTVVLNVVLSILAAYPLERMEFPGKQFIFLCIISTMMIPFQVTMIPLYISITNLKLIDTFTATILPFAVSAFGIFLLRQTIRAIPTTYDEAAYLDGCNSWKLLWLIIVPLIKPSIATLSIFTFVNAWSNFQWPLLVLQNKLKKTLPLGLLDLQGTFTTDWRLITAGAVLAMIPIIIFFAFTQKYFIEGATEGGVKE